MPIFDTHLLVLLAVFVAAYFVGTIPSGILWSRFFGLGDLREVGSGNVGATNVLRTGHKLAAFLTLICDAAKGAVPVLVGRAIAGEDAAQFAALGAFLGHLFMVWLKFKGGKGVATFLGIVLALSPFAGLACCGTWLVIALATRYSSLAALIAAALSTLWVFLFGYGQGFFLFILLTALLYLRHADNIARMRLGTEPKIGQR